MKNLLLFISTLLFALSAYGQTTTEDKDIAYIKQAMQEQQAAWNAADINTFMEWYWKSDQLQFIGGAGPTYGWQATLERYKRNYPNPEAMGKLRFDILEVNKRSKKVISMVGKFTLTRINDQPTGHFLLIWQKIKGKWVIVADCTSPNQ